MSILNVFRSLSQVFASLSAGRGEVETRASNGKIKAREVQPHRRGKGRRQISHLARGASSQRSLLIEPTPWEIEITRTSPASVQ
jgi:hypothetical protein